MRAAGSVRTRLRGRFRTEGPQVIRIVIAAALSWQICVWLGAQQPPVFAVVLPVLALRDHPYSVFNLSLDRMIGVICGVLLAEGMVRLLGVSVLTVALVLAIGLTVGIVLRIGAVLNVQVAVSAMLVFANPEPGAYGLARVWETAVAAVVCVVLSPLLLPPNARRTFEDELRRVTEALVGQLDDLQALLRVAADQEASDRAALVDLDDRTVRTDEAARALPASLAAAERAVRHNPLRRADLGPLSAYAGRVRLAGELARVERLLLDEMLDLSDRSDLLDVWPDFRQPLLRVLEPATAAVRAALDGAPATRVAGLEAQADAEIMRWRHEDTRPITAVMRRPLRRLLDVLPVGDVPDRTP